MPIDEDVHRDDDWQKVQTSEEDFMIRYEGVETVRYLRQSEACPEVDCNRCKEDGRGIPFESRSSDLLGLVQEQAKTDDEDGEAEDLECKPC